MSSPRRATLRPLTSPQLRVLLNLSRELLQADAAASSLDLIGRALAELVQPSRALLLVRGETVERFGFGRDGEYQATVADGLLEPLAARQLEIGAAGVPRATAAPDAGLAARTLALAVPPHAPMAALAVVWDHDRTAAQLQHARRTMSYVLELAAAALGKIEARDALEQQLYDQREELAETADAHSVELARRDAVASELRLLSLTDVLTGLYNRRGFFLQAEQIFKVAQRMRTESAVIFADVDGLKRVNDQQGHDAGDSLLRDAAFVFRQSFRQADVLARLGGDEFVAYTLDDAQPGAVLERIQANLRAFNLMQDRPYTVSLSAGMVTCDPGSAQPLIHYVQLADDRMYAQKRGRLH